jgi:hypothetical protein
VTAARDRLYEVYHFSYIFHYFSAMNELQEAHREIAEREKEIAGIKGIFLGIP